MIFIEREEEMSVIARNLREMQDLDADEMWQEKARHEALHQFSQKNYAAAKVIVLQLVLAFSVYRPIYIFVLNDFAPFFLLILDPGNTSVRHQEENTLPCAYTGINAASSFPQQSYQAPKKNSGTKHVELEKGTSRNPKNI